MADGDTQTGFKAKVAIKRKRLPSQPIHVTIHASQENEAEGGKYGSPYPGAAQQAALKFPSSPGVRKPRGSFKAIGGRAGQIDL